MNHPYMTRPAREGELDWQDDALCAQTDPEVFFPARGGLTVDAKRICAACPVRDKCLEWAMEAKPMYGMYAGLSTVQIRKLAKKRKANA